MTTRRTARTTAPGRVAPALLHHRLSPEDLGAGLDCNGYQIPTAGGTTERTPESILQALRDFQPDMRRTYLIATRWAFWALYS